MRRRHKELLLKDLCARLPYGVKCDVGDNKPYTLNRIEIDNNNGHLLDFIEKKNGLDMQVYLSEVKPYLLPVESMTEEQIEKFEKCGLEDYHDYDWYNKNNFDYRGLIPMGLAIDTTNLNIY
jgi:hypothetical protein